MGKAHIDIIIQFHSPRAIQLDLFQRLPNNIVGLPLRGLGCLDHGSFVNVSFVLDIELPKSILEAEDVGLLELGVFPSTIDSQQADMNSVIEAWKRCLDKGEFLATSEA